MKGREMFGVPGKEVMPWGRTANSLFYPGVLLGPKSTAGDILVLSYLSKLQPWRVRACRMTSPAQDLRGRKDCKMQRFHQS